MFGRYSVNVTHFYYIMGISYLEHFAANATNVKRFPVNVFSKMANNLIPWMETAPATTTTNEKHQWKRKTIDTYTTWISFRHLRIEPSMLVQEVILFIWLVYFFSCLLAACFAKSNGIFLCAKKWRESYPNFSPTGKTEEESNEIAFHSFGFGWCEQCVCNSHSKSIFSCLEICRGFIWIRASPLFWLFVTFSSFCFSF